ncbi:hypothetical protein [Saccharopolyspora spinosa]|uniref:Uncharacterized protein n=1 Tax=Saccharopolyspora spinosa TaxID=60894 RepID=A0A2N3Y4X3_SACSN|nr:hypothetical protein [Saccharopolyspora spinosa]PKW17881.1 hypothetical protein A8926_5906 [Saccharopolyspora spinosa]
MDTSSADVDRLLRVLAVRTLALAFIAGIVGEEILAMLFAIAGVGLLMAPIGAGAAHRRDVN